MEYGRDACPLLAARLVIPATSSRQHILRERLLRKLDSSLHTALTLVKAPAGFGKTTLVSQWVHSRHLATAWVSLGSSENNPLLFWRYVIAGLEHLHPSIAEHMAGWSLSSPSQSSELALAALSNALMALSDDLVLVLDNYQHITDAGIERSLLSLLEYCPLPLHVILLTRQETRLPLARLRLNNKVHELSALDLCFSLEETREVLSLVVPRYTRQESAALYQQTRGWIAGLLLSLPELHQAAEDTCDNSSAALPEDSQRSLHAYLMEEVWTSLPAWIQSFLLQTSILDRFNAQLCDTVIGQARGQEALAYLAGAGLFLIPLQDQEGWYCYAPYIASLFRSQLQRIDPARIPLLHRRAVAWYEQQQRPVEAIEHAQQAQESEQLACLLERYGELLLHEGHMAFIASALEALPSHLLIERPLCGYLRAFTLLAAGQFEQCRQIISCCEQRWMSNVDAQVWARICNLRAFLALFRGEPCHGITRAQRALELAPEEDWLTRSHAKALLALGYLHTGELAQTADALQQAYCWSLHSRSMMALQLVALVRGELQLVRGQLHEAEGAFQQLVREAEAPWVWVQALAHTRLGEIAWQWNNLDQARQQCQQAIQVIEQFNQEGWICALPLLLAAQLAWDCGEGEQAALRLGQAERAVNRWGSPQFLQAQIVALRVRFWLAQDHPQSRWEEWLVSMWGGMQISEWGLIQARIHREQGELSKASKLLQELLNAVHARGHVNDEIAVLVQLALVSAAQADPARAFRCLERALILAEPGGYTRSFASEGEPMAALLTSYIHLSQRTAARTQALCSPFYMRRVMAALGIKVYAESPPSLPGGPRGQHKEIVCVEPLSDRERAVLGLVARGYSNAQIAQHLVLTVHTVKTHVRNIYAKMQVHTRVQAVVKARGSGLLEAGEAPESRLIGS